MKTKFIQPNDVFGYILMENDYESVSEVTDLDVIQKYNLFFIRFNTVLQSLNCTNRNKKNYNGDGIVRSMSTTEINELLHNGKLHGEAGHPIDGTPRRIATIDPKYTCHKINKWWRDGDLIRATVETLDDGMYGTKLTKAILQGMNPSFSYRGFAQLDKRDKVSYVVGTPTYITHDEVHLPSHKEAYADKEKNKIVKNFSGGETILETDYSRAILGSDIQSMLERDSDNVKIICESFNLDISTLQTMGNGNLSIMNGTDKFVFRGERQLVKKYTDLWSQL